MRFAEFPGNRAILSADLRAARFALTISAGESQTIVSDFLSLHDDFTQTIRSRVVEMMHARRQTLEPIVRSWADLYVGALAELRRRHPQSQEPDLVWKGTNWSRELGVGAYGLMSIASASRYAESWAEATMKDARAGKSYEARLRFLDTEEYRLVGGLQEKGELRILGQEDRLGVNAFDLVARLGQARAGVDMRAWLRQAGWHPVMLTERAEDTLAELTGIDFRKRATVSFESLPNAALESYLRGQGPTAAMARRLCKESPHGPARVAVDRSSRLVGCLLSAGEADDSEQWLIASQRVAAAPLLESLKARREFVRLGFSPVLVEDVMSSYPAQPVRGVPVYTAMNPGPPRQVDGELEYEADRVWLNASEDGRASATLTVLDESTVLLSDLEAGVDSQATVAMLSAIARDHGQLGRTVLFVGPAEDWGALPVDIPNSVLVGCVGVLDEWFFEARRQADERN